MLCCIVLCCADHPSEEVWEGGTNAVTAGVVKIFSGLTVHENYTLSVQVWPTDFGSRAEYVDSIVVNGVALSTYCRPAGGDCAGGWHTCALSDEDVTGLIDASGTLVVRSTATSSVNYCPHKGFFLYTKYIVHGRSDLIAGAVFLRLVC